MKELPSSTSDDIEMRLCADSSCTDEDITFETVELYVHCTVARNSFSEPCISGNSEELSKLSTLCWCSLNVLVYQPSSGNLIIR